VVDPDGSAGEREATVRCPSGNRPRRVRATRGAKVPELLGEVGLANREGPVIVVSGGAKQLDDSRRRMFRASEVLGRGVLRAARDHKAAIVDGGTRSGVIRIVGEARGVEGADDDVLVGVAPAGKVREPGEEHGTELEPNHTHFVLADGEDWGDETELLFRVAEALSKGGPAVVVLLSGGPIARDEVLEAVRREWPIVVVRGFGGFSRSLLVAHWVDRAARWLGLARPVSWLTEKISPELRMTVERGQMSFFSGGSSELARWIDWEFADRPALKEVWRTFAAYDAQAAVLQTIFRISQMAIIALGILGTALATFHAWAAGVDEDAARLLTTIAPALVALLIALGTRFAFGKRWIFLREAAESVKAETYRYRTETGPYRSARSRDAVLVDRVATIRTQLLETEAAAGRLSADKQPGPPPALPNMSLADLGAADYAGSRTADQIAFYHRTVRRKTWRRNCLQVIALGVAAAGSVIAAFGHEPWVAVTTAVSAGAASYLATRQHEQNVLTYNRAAGDLQSTYDEWLATSADVVPEPGEVRRKSAGANGHGPREADGKERLVERTETVLTDEVGAWARRMARVLDEEAKRQREHEAASAGAR
jgi:hypothetical protein